MGTLPFMTNKSKDGGVAGPVESVERKPDEPEEFDSLHGAMQELHSAMNAKDYKSAAEIFRSAFELLDSEPHEEGPHV
jgi:hypothetical protein